MSGKQMKVFTTATSVAEPWRISKRDLCMGNGVCKRGIAKSMTCRDGRKKLGCMCGMDENE